MGNAELGYNGNPGNLRTQLNDDGKFTPGIDGAPGTTRLTNPQNPNSYFEFPGNLAKSPRTAANPYFTSSFAQPDWRQEEGTLGPRLPQRGLPMRIGDRDGAYYQNDWKNQPMHQSTYTREGGLPPPIAPQANSPGAAPDNGATPQDFPSFQEISMDSGNPGLGTRTGYNPALIPRSSRLSPPPPRTLDPRESNPHNLPPTPPSRLPQPTEEEQRRSQDNFNAFRTKAFPRPIPGPLERRSVYPGLDGSAFNAHDFIKTREESQLIPGLITDPIMNELLATMLA